MSTAALDPSPIVPARIVVDAPRPWLGRLVAGAGEGAASLLLNMVVLAALAHWAFPAATPLPDTQAISVDIVNEPPKAGATESKREAADTAEPVATAEPPGTKPEIKAGAAPGSTEPDRPLQDRALPDKPAHDAPPAGEAAEEKLAADLPARPPSAPAAPAAPAPAPLPSALTPAAATPPPIGLNDANPAPRLIEAPPDPRDAARQNAKNVIANAATEAVEAAKPTESPPPAIPPVVTAPAGEDAVPAGVPAPSPNPVATAEAKREAENTAKLAAALPFSQTYVPDPERAAVAGSGGSPAEQYRGAVYGSFRKAADLVEAARARHLHGQAVIAFSIDDTGALASAKVAVSSGDASVDETAMEIIRRSAPYPPPPPGGQHSFSPAIGIGVSDP